MTKFIRILSCILTIAFFVYFWNAEPMKPLKMFVVMLHEVSHGIGTLLTGGTVKGFTLGLDESGLLKSRGGVFFIIAISGYLGSIIWGVLMLRSALSGKYHRHFSFVLAVVLIAFTVLPGDLNSRGVTTSIDENWIRYAIGFSWGFIFLTTAMYTKRLNQVLLFMLGLLTCMYAIFDLDDFISGRILQTDAGILAIYLAGGMNGYTLPLAYAIAGSISMLTCFILYVYIQELFQSNPDNETLDLDQQSSELDFESEDPNSLEWIEKMHTQRAPKKKLWIW